MRQLLKVIERAETHDLTTLETVHAELGLVEPDSTIDTRLAILITQASSAISGYCNRIFGAEIVEETFWSEHWYECVDSLVLARPPIIEVDTIVVDDNRVLVEDEDYAVDIEKGIIILLTAGAPRWWHSFRSMKVTYTGGYELMDLLPEALERACIQLVQGMHYAQGRDLNMRSENVPDVYNYALAAGGSNTGGSAAQLIAPDIAVMLSPYKRWPL